MTVRQKLIDRLPAWLAYISSANGYTNTVREVYKGHKPMSAENADLLIWFMLGEEKVTDFDEAGTNPEAEASLFLGWCFRSDAGEGKMIDKCESMIADLNKWCYRAAANSKYILPDAETTGDLSPVDTISSTGVEPVYSFDGLFGTLYYEIKIKYRLQF